VVGCLSVVTWLSRVSLVLSVICLIDLFFFFFFRFIHFFGAFYLKWLGTNMRQIQLNGGGQCDSANDPKFSIEI
jgi:threonine/homoserine/homoserine lactone efflux protein